MARGRFISKAISLDEKVDALSNDTVRLLFTWMITHLDCEGRTYGDPQTIKSIVFPRRCMDVRTMQKYLDELVKSGLIQRYINGGSTFICLPNFQKHQPGLNKDKESPSQIPPIPQELIQSNNGVTLTEVKVKDKVKVKEGEGGMGETDRNDLYKILEGTKGFPKYSQENIWKLEDVIKDYPGVNYLLEFKKFKEYWNTRQLKRPWLALRNWLDKAKEKVGKARNPRDLPKTYTKSTNDDV